MTILRYRKANMKKINDYFTKIQYSLMLTSEILMHHGYNVINVEDGNHGEIMKRNRCFSALRDFMTTLSETQAGGGQPGVQVASSEWRKVLKFGDGVWPPEPPRSWIPEWVTIPDPTMPACTEDQQVRTKATSWTTTWIQSTATALSIGETTTAEGKTNITIGTDGTFRAECIGISSVRFSWTTTATGGTQACGEANAKT